MPASFTPASANSAVKKSIVRRSATATQNDPLRPTRRKSCVASSLANGCSESS
jgi:hypothetical protein